MTDSKPSYTQHIAWIAKFDSSIGPNALQLDDVVASPAVMMVADLFGVEHTKVGSDVIAYRFGPRFAVRGDRVVAAVAIPTQVALLEVTVARLTDKRVVLPRNAWEANRELQAGDQEFVLDEDLDDCCQWLESQGYEVAIGAGIGPLAVG